MSGLTAWERWELANFDVETPSANGETQGRSTIELERREVDRVLEEARREGYQTGYEAGQAAVLAEANRLASAASGLAEALAQFDQEVADELVALATEIARQVIRGELSARQDIILNVVHEALSQLPHQHATVFLHPDDASLVRSYAGDALAHAGHRILEEPRLNPGDCILESGSSQVDATLATRWRRVIETLGLASAWSVQDPP
jgi:flagellar assembly protein FliH